MCLYIIKTFHLVLRIEADFKTSLIMGRSENAKKMNENNIINYREKE
jgi:hypothetical protein